MAACLPLLVGDVLGMHSSGWRVKNAFGCPCWSRSDNKQNVQHNMEMFMNFLDFKAIFYSRRVNKKMN
jgi:hypothetical protein